MQKRIYIVLFFITCSFNLKAQEDTAAYVQAIASSKNGHILLRWTPSNVKSWVMGNKYGYTIKRYTITRNSKKLEQAEVKTLAENLKPLPLEQWEAIMEKDTLAGVIAQALYGESFELESNSDIMSVYDQSFEYEQRFGFTLLTIERNFNFAQYAALGFIDSTAKPNEGYGYEIIPNTPSSVYSIDTGKVLGSATMIYETPAPKELQAIFQDKKVMLVWNFKDYQYFYSQYILERSDDTGKTYHPISDLPIIPFDFSEDGTQTKYFHSDSLPQNYTLYFYRLRGLNAFGELSPPSDTVYGFGYSTLPANPFIINTSYIDEEKVEIEWEFPESANNLIQRFNILLSKDAKTGYDTIARVNVNDRKYIINTYPNAAYIIVDAVANQGLSSASFPVLIQKIDSIPPLPPIGLKGIIDSAGIVTLTWNNNTESDLAGYRVYFSNNENDEYSQKTISPIKTNSFIDTVSLAYLTKNIYYKVIAVDNRHNMSYYSLPIKVLKPDTIKPVSPIFTQVKATKEGAVLNFNKSSSNDVVSFSIFRRKKEEDKWYLVKEFSQTDSTHSFIDDNIQEETIYEYVLQAKDESNNLSEFSPIASVQKLFNNNKTGIEKLKANFNVEKKIVELTWKANQDEVDKIFIYKAKGASGFILIKLLNDFTQEYIDDKITIGLVHKYCLQVQFKNGTRGPLTTIIEIKM